MFCSNCGAQVGDNEKFCKVCGTAVNVQAAAPAMQQAPVYQQPVPQPAPQPAVQPAPVYQQPVQAVPQAAAPAKVKGGPRRACFVVGLITDIMLILEIFPAGAIGVMMFFVGPFAMMLGASNSDDLFVYGLLILLGAAILLAMAIVSIVLNGICTKITGRRPASKCRSLRMAASIITMIDAVIVIAPIIGLNNIMSDAEFFYGIFAVTFIMAIVFLVLAIITNSKEKKLAA